ncbi:MAG: hypothetical protein R2764_23835 [Bacteroidales bacterium]
MVFGINPFIEFSIENNNDRLSRSASLIVENYLDMLPETPWINANNWLAGVGTGKNSKINSEGKNIVGASFAACLGNALLFDMFLKRKLIITIRSRYSLYDFGYSESVKHLNNPENVGIINVGKILQIGCGAVGSSLAYLLSIQDWTGSLTLIDFDTVKTPNCSSSLVFSALDSVDNRLKIDCCEEILQITRVNKFNGDYSDFLKSSLLNYDIILCLANERNIWSTIQNNYPPIVLHATTNDSWGINMGRHIPIKEWCILCRFKDELKTNL